MRKVISIMVMTVGVITLMSCEKEYSCSCKEVDISTGKTTNTWSPMKATLTKADAQKWCSSYETSDFGIRIECSLK